MSRDGTRITYFDYDTGELWKADGAKRERLAASGTFGPAQNGRLSPDGRLLAFIDPTGPKGPVVRVQSMDDPGNVREITATGVRQGAAEISPDGRSIAFSSFGEQNRPAVTVCDLEACAPRKTLPASGTEMHWMPDGQGLAYIDLSHTIGPLGAANRRRRPSPIDTLRGRRAAHLGLRLVRGWQAAGRGPRADLERYRVVQRTAK